MYRSILLLISLLLLSSQSINAQNDYCDGIRYKDDIFTNVNKIADVKFGENTTFGGSFRDLDMDIYEPAGDLATERPVIILAFGGSYVAGSKGAMQSYCEGYARKGYLAVSIDYRIWDGSIFNFPDSLDMLDVVVKSIGDMKAAVRFLRKDAATTDLYRVDSENIFIGGYSAGAITALHAGMIDYAEIPAYLAFHVDNNGGMEGDTDDPANSAIGYSSEVKGIVSYSGALHRRVFIDANDPPLFSIHGDADGTVPIGFGGVGILGSTIMTVDGSGTLHPQADQVGLNNFMITVPGGGHTDIYSQQNWLDSLDRHSSRFMENLICKAVLPVELTNFTGKAESNAILLEWNTVSELNSDYFEIQHSLDEINFEAIGQVAAAGNSIDPLQYAFQHRSPNKGTNYYRLRLVDEDGSYSYSDIVAVEHRGIKGTVQVAPSPFDQNVDVNLSGLVGSTTFQLFNATGQLVFSEQWELNGADIQTVATGDLASGMYVYRVINQRLSYDGKIVKR